MGLFIKTKKEDNKLVDNTANYVKLEPNKFCDSLIEQLQSKISILGIVLTMSNEFEIKPTNVKEVHYDREDIRESSDFDDNFGYIKEVFEKADAYNEIMYAIVKAAINEQRKEFKVCMCFLEKGQKHGHVAIIAWD